MVATTFDAGSTPITVRMPWSASGRSSTPSLQPNSSTVALAGSRNRFVTSAAYSLKWSRRVPIDDEK